MTDPGNCDYAVEFGATRNFEPRREEEEDEEAETGDAIKSLENKIRDSKREQEIDAALGELESLRSRCGKVSTDAMLEALQLKRREEEEKVGFEEDEAVIRSIFQSREVIVRRISDDDDLELRTNLKKERKVSEDASSRKTTYSSFIKANVAGDGKDNATKVSFKPMARISVIRNSTAEKIPRDEKNQEESFTMATGGSGTGLQSLCQYGNDDDE